MQYLLPKHAPEQLSDENDRTVAQIVAECLAEDPHMRPPADVCIERLRACVGWESTWFTNPLSTALDHNRQVRGTAALKAFCGTLESLGCRMSQVHRESNEQRSYFIGCEMIPELEQYFHLMLPFLMWSLGPLTSDMLIFKLNNMRQWNTHMPV